MVIQLLPFFFANPKLEVADLCKSTLVNAFQIFSMYEGCLTIISRGRVGYDVIDSQGGAQHRVGDNHLISNKREWNNCFIKNAHKISLNLLEQNKPEKTRDFRYSHVTRLSKLSTRERTRLDCMNEKSKHCRDEHQFFKNSSGFQDFTQQNS